MARKASEPAATSIAVEQQPTVTLTPGDLARRWQTSAGTLERWRGEGRGPRYLKLGNLIRYLPEDVEAFEQRSLCASTGEAA